MSLILKNGGKADKIRDYRSITVTSVLYRVFVQALKGWIEGWAESERHLTELQNSFRRGRRLEDSIFVITQCAEIARKEGRSLVCCALDAEKAYDSVPHCDLFERLAVLGLPAKLLCTIQRLYSDNVVAARFGTIETGRIRVNRGLRQGCPMSPLLYLLYVAGVERALLQSGLGFGLRYTTSGIDDNRRIPGLAYADDLLLMADSPRDLQSLLDICAAEMKGLGLRFNAQKTTVVQLAGKMAEGTVLKLEEEVLQIASSVKYLGVTLCSGADLFGLHEERVGKTALRAQCILRRRCLWG